MSITDSDNQGGACATTPKHWGQPCYTDHSVEAETPYTYRIKAINGAGPSERSRWFHIDTPAAPSSETTPEPANTPATGTPTISGTVRVGEMLTADTSGIADEDGLDNATFTYQWLAGDSDISGATDDTYTLADSDEGKAISIKVSFTDDAGNDETLTSAATEAVAAPEPPASPTGLSATASHDSVTLIWDDPGDDTITDYVVLRRNRDIHAEGEFTNLVEDTGTAATTYTDDTVEPETPYTYRIKAINEHGESERSRWFHIDTPAAPDPADLALAEPPASPTGLAAEVSHDSVTLTWDDPGDDSITGYLILRRDSAIHEEGTFETVESDTGSAETAYTDDSAQPERKCVYRIKAINKHGLSEISSWVRAYTPAAPVPAAPTGLSATASHDQVVLTWDDPGDDSITGYVILRRNRDIHAEGEFTTLVKDTGGAATTYTDDSVASDTPYTYRIKAINEHGGVSERSRWFHIDTPAAPLLAAPTGVGVAVSSDTVMLIWADPQDDSITGYRILRRDGDAQAGGEFTTIESDTGSAATTYTDDTVEPDLVYVYRVLAISPHGVSEPSRDVEVSTAAPKEPLLSQPAQVTRVFHHVSEPSGSDFPADDTTTGVAVWGSTVTGNIDDPSDVDWFLLDAQAGLLYQIDLGPEPVTDAADDPELVGIYDASGALLPRTSNDNLSVNRLASRVFFSSSEDGAYYVAVGSADSGSYRLSVSLIRIPLSDSVSEEMGDDFTDSGETAGLILVGGTVTGNIDRASDFDWFQTQLEAGHRYQIDVEGADTSQGTLTDPVLNNVRGYLARLPLTLFQIPHATDNNSGSGKNARITFTMPDDYFEAPVYISVAGNTTTGTYRMRLREVVPLGGGKPIEAQLEPGDTVSGTFDPFTWYYFALDGLTSGRYTVSFSKGAIEAIYAPGNLITDQPHGAATYTFDVRSTGTPQTRYVWLVVWGDAGSYTVSLEETMLDLVVGGPPAAGEIPKTTDLIVAPGGPWGTSMQFFPVELEAGVVYQVDIKGVDTGDGTMDYPMLANIAAPDGSYVGGTTHLFVQGGGEGRNVRYVFTADQDGMYFLKAGGALWKVYDVMDNYIGTRYRAGTFTVSIRETEEAPSCTLNRGDLWCGVVTVGSGGDIDGYAREEIGDIGDLSDTDVDVGPNSYTIAGIFVDGETSVIPGTLSIVFHPNTRPTAADRDTLVLQVGGRSDSFAFSDAFVVAGRSVSWTSAGLDWSEEEYVIVRLREK